MRQRTLSSSGGVCLHSFAIWNRLLRRHLPVMKCNAQSARASSAMRQCGRIETQSTLRARSALRTRWRRRLCRSFRWRGSNWQRLDVRNNSVRIFSVEAERRHRRQRMRSIGPCGVLQERLELFVRVASGATRQWRRVRRPRHFDERSENEIGALQRARHIRPLRRHRRMAIVAAADRGDEILAAFDQLITGQRRRGGRPLHACAQQRCRAYCAAQ